MYHTRKQLLSLKYRAMKSPNIRTPQSLKSILAGTIIIAAAAFSVSAQGYVIEIHGVWKRPNGVTVKNRTRLARGVELTSTSGQSGDYIIIADMDGEIVKSCSDGCQKIVVPNTISLSKYLWCELIFRCDEDMRFFGVKGEECANFDGIVSLNKKGVTDFSPILDLLKNKAMTLRLKFQRKEGQKIYEEERDLTVSNPKLRGFRAGIYDVLDGSRTSRILVLPAEIYNKEKSRFVELKKKISRWKEHDLSNCTIKSFTQAYIDYVEKENRKEIKKYK